MNSMPERGTRTVYHAYSNGGIMFGHDVVHILTPVVDHDSSRSPMILSLSYLNLADRKLFLTLQSMEKVPSRRV